MTVAAVAVWTQRIRELANLFQHHRKNYHQMRYARDQRQDVAVLLEKMQAVCGVAHVVANPACSPHHVIFSSDSHTFHTHPPPRSKLELMFNRRRRLLTYLRKNDFEAYCFVVQKLGLKDVYAEIVSGPR